MIRNLFKNKKILFLFTAVVAVLFLGKTVFAVWSGTFYEPGDTLNPECSPTDVDCDVRPPLTSVNIDDTVYGGAWDSDATHAPSKNAVYDKIEGLVAGSHDAVTIGTANGLSLATQVLSLALASTSTTGALSDTDWDTFNDKAPTASPTFTTSITAPLIYGGTATTQDLTLQTTTGVGDTGADMHFLVGNNGATEAMTILNSGYVGIGATEPRTSLDVAGNIVLGSDYSYGASWNLTVANTIGDCTDAFMWAREGVPAGGMGWSGCDVAGGWFIINTADGSESTVISDLVSYFNVNGGNVGIGTNDPTANLQVAQGTIGPGTVTITGTDTVTGTGTQFTNTFKVGDTITIDNTPETVAILSITSDTEMTVDTATNTIDSTYSLTGGTRFSVLGNGFVGIGTVNPLTLSHIFQTQAVYDANPEAPILIIESEAVAGAVPLEFRSIDGDTTPRSFRMGLGVSDNDLFTFGNMYQQVSTGNVGIGAAAPGYPLHISSDTGVATNNPVAYFNGLYGTDGSYESYVNIANDVDDVMRFGISGSTYNEFSGVNSEGFLGMNASVPLTFFTANIAAITIDSSQRVGIGTVLPQSVLHIVGAGGIPAATGSMDTGIIFENDGGGGPALNMGTYNNENVDGLYYGWIQSGYADSAETTLPLALQPNGGYVGIGTTEPLSLLHIEKNDTVANSPMLKIVNSGTGTNNYSGIELRSHGASSMWVDFTPSSTNDTGYGTPDYGGRVLYNAADNRMEFGTNSIAQRVVIDSSGNVGIGISSPATVSAARLLHIGGAATSEIHLTNTNVGDAATDGLVIQSWSDSGSSTNM